MIENKNELEFNLMKSLEIINQLSTAKVTKALRPLNLSYSQFSLLNHFSNDPEQEFTVSQLANSMQMNQPGITKIVNKLTEMGLIEIRKDLQDARKKWLKINTTGQEKLSLAQSIVMNDISDCFSGWEVNELEDMLKHAQRLQTWFDNNR